MKWLLKEHGMMMASNVRRALIYNVKPHKTVSRKIRGKILRKMSKNFEIISSLVSRIQDNVKETKWKTYGKTL